MLSCHESGYASEFRFGFGNALKCHAFVFGAALAPIIGLNLETKFVFASQIDSSLV